MPTTPPTLYKLADGRVFAPTANGGYSHIESPDALYQQYGANAWDYVRNVDRLPGGGGVDVPTRDDGATDQPGDGGTSGGNTGTPGSRTTTDRNGNTTVNVYGPTDRNGTSRPSINFQPTGGFQPTTRSAERVNLQRQAPNPYQPREVAPGSAGPSQLTQPQGFSATSVQAPGYQAPRPPSTPQGFGQGRVPPPPPPPPPVQGAPYGQSGGLGQQVQGYAASWLAQGGNRYSTPLMQGRMQQVQAADQQARDRGLADVDSWAASRGLVGSSVEGQRRNDLLTQLDQNRRSAENDLLSQLAAADTGDRQGAAQFAAGQAQYADQADRQVGRDYEDDLRARAGLQLQGAGLDLQGRGQDLGAWSTLQGLLQQRDALDLQASGAQNQFNLNAAQLGLSQRGQDLGAWQALQGLLQNQDQLRENARQFDAGQSLAAQQFNAGMGLNTWQAYQNALQNAQGMDLTEATSNANRQLDADRLGLQERQVYSDQQLQQIMMLLNALQATRN